MSAGEFPDEDEGQFFWGSPKYPRPFTRARLEHCETQLS